MVVPSVYSALVWSGVKFCLMVLLMYLNGPLVFLFVKCFDTVILHLGLEPVSFSNFNVHPLSCAQHCLAPVLAVGKWQVLVVSQEELNHTW